MNNLNREYPDFSVSMCVYGGDDPANFKTAVGSILEQTVKPTEIVLVVDGHVPKELDDIVSVYEKDPLFNVIRLKTNQGHGNARRTGLKNCNFDLVALMDADDISLPERFEKQLELFKKDPGLSVVGGYISEFEGEPDNVISLRVVPKKDPDIKKYAKTRCPMNQVTVMFKKEDVENVGGYIDWFCEEDYYLWLRLIFKGYRFENIEETLVNVRVCRDTYFRRGGLLYFRSEAKLQGFMLQNKMISAPTYIMNIMKRSVLQMLLPTKLRGKMIQKFARKKAK